MSLVSAPGEPTCPSFVPLWEMPRADVMARDE
jgi:hypothetical protein